VSEVDRYHISSFDEKRPKGATGQPGARLVCVAFWEVWAQTVALAPVETRAGKRVLKKTLVERYWKGPYDTEERARREADRLGEKWGRLFIVKSFAEELGHVDTERSVPESECSLPTGGGADDERSLPESAIGSGEEWPHDGDDDGKPGHLVF
jgi:hypothetical protein